MKERNSTAPKLRKGETLPMLPEGFVPTRVDGKIIGVSEHEETEVFVGKSGYTRRQLGQIDLYRNRTRGLQNEQQAAILEAERILFQHRTEQIAEARQAALQADVFVREEQKFVTVDDAMFVVEAYIQNFEFYRQKWDHLDGRKKQNMYNKEENYE